MSNAQRGEVSLKAGDTTYTLSLSVNALCELEEVTGEPVARIANSLNDPDNVRITTVRALVWAALRDHHSEASMTDAGRIVGEAGVPAVMEAVGTAFERAFPDDEAEGKANPPKAKAG